MKARRVEALTKGKHRVCLGRRVQHARESCSPVHPASQYDIRNWPVSRCIMKAPERACDTRQAAAVTARWLREFGVGLQMAVVGGGGT